MTMRRPPLNRGHSMPTYPSQVTSYAPVDSALPSLASLSLSDSRKSIVGDQMRRSTGSEGSTPPRDSSVQTSSPYPPPTLFSSASVNGPHPQPHSSSYLPSIPRSRSHTSQSSSSTYVPSPNLPAITFPPVNNISSALLRNRSMHPQSSSSVNLKIDSTPHEYILLAPLGSGFSSDSITIAARRGNVIVVVADRWDQEQDCHYEWQVQFDRDADMSSIHASFENGLLRVTVRRITNYFVRQ